MLQRSRERRGCRYAAAGDGERRPCVWCVVVTLFSLTSLVVTDDEVSANAEAFGRVLMHYAVMSLTRREDLQHMPYKTWSCHRKTNRTRLHVVRERTAISKAAQKKCDSALVDIIKKLRKHAILDVEDEECDETEAASAAKADDDMFA